MPKTRLASLPASINERNLLDAVRLIAQTLDIWRGERADPLDAVVTYRALTEGGFDVTIPPANTGQGPVVTPPGNGAADRVVPPAPSGFVVKPGLATILLYWDSPDAHYGNHAYTEIWRSQTDDLGSAVLQNRQPGWMWADFDVLPGQTYYYWVRWVSEAGMPGPYNATAGTPGAVSADPAYLLQVLAQAITEGQLDQSLTSRIDLIDTPVTGLLARLGEAEADILNNAQQITSLSALAGDTALDPAVLWDFDASLDGWTAANATLSAAIFYMEVDATGANPELISPDSLGVDGGRYQIVSARLRRVGSGTGWKGDIFYSTSGHGFSASYTKAIAKPDDLDTGAWVVARWDMESLDAGGDDWISSTIDRIRLDLGVDGDDDFEIDWIVIARFSPPASSAALNALTSRVDTAEGSISSLSGSLTTLQGQVNDATTGLSATYNATQTLIGRADQTDLDVQSNSDAITGLQSGLNTAQGQITANSSALSGLSTDVASRVDPAPGASWTFDVNAMGWTLNGTQTWQADGTVRIAAADTDPRWESPAISVNGAQYRYVVARIKRVAGTAWEGNCRYSTSGHGFSGSFRRNIAEPSYDAEGWGYAIFDMHALTAGGTDWRDSVITGIRLDFGNSADTVFDVDWVAVGRRSTSASSGQLVALGAQLTDAQSALSAQADAITLLDAGVTNLNGQMSAQASQVTQLRVSSGTDNLIPDGSFSLSATYGLGPFWQNHAQASVVEGWNGSPGLRVNATGSIHDVHAHQGGFVLYIPVEQGDTLYVRYRYRPSSDFNGGIGGLHLGLTTYSASLSSLSSWPNLGPGTVVPGSWGEVAGTIQVTAPGAAYVAVRVSVRNTANAGHVVFDDIEISRSVPRWSALQIESRVTGVEAQWTVKTDVDGYVAGIGLINTGTLSQFIVRADQFAVAPPGGAPNDFFLIDDGNVYMRSAFIQEASITSLMASDAFLTNLTAVHGTLAQARIQQGNIFNLTVGNLIESENFGATTGWRVSRNGTATFNQGAFGNSVTIGSRTVQQINNNLTTFDGWVRPDTTLIDGNKIFTGDAYVDTLQIKGQAVTFPVGVYTAGQVDAYNFGGGSWLTVQTLTGTFTGAPILIFAAASVGLDGDEGAGTWFGGANARLVVNGSVVWSGAVIIHGAYQTSNGYTLRARGSISINTRVEPASGTVTIQLQVQRASLGSNWSNLLSGVDRVPVSSRSLTAIEAKR